jgi:hypothetical protein
MVTGCAGNRLIVETAGGGFGSTSTVGTRRHASQAILTETVPAEINIMAG